MKAPSAIGLVLRRNERRQWWLWATAIVITLLLTFAAASLAFAALGAQGEVFYFLNTRQAVYGLLGLVLLFDIYAIYQQLQNRRIHVQLDEQHEIFRLIGENAADMIAVVDVNGRRLYNSPSYQRVLGYSADELEDTVSFEQIHPDDRQLVKEAAEDARRTGHGRNVEYRFRHKDGTWRILESTASVIRNATGDPEKLIIINRDITARRQAEKESRENQFRQVRKMEAMGRLSGGIAHDFNNLLSVILGHVEVLTDCTLNNELPHKSVQAIGRAGQRAASLTRQLLAFSRQQVLEPKVLDLNAVVADVGTMLRRLIGEDVELTTTVEQNLGRVMADRGQIEQVIMNLVINARDAMPDGGKLTITTANVELDENYVCQLPEVHPGSYVQLSVADSGVGMDAATQAHIFEPFFTTKELGRGTGLGLATVYGIIKQSNGYIWVYSELGTGTIFKIYLPRVAGEVEVPSTEVGEVRSQQEGKKGETILLVEDEESLREVTRDLLQQSGYIVLEANCGEHALEIANQHSGAIDLLLTDVVMPGMNGPALVEKLGDSHPETKILYMSGYTDHAIGRNGVLELNVLLLDKPFTRCSLMSKVQTASKALKVTDNHRSGQTSKPRRSRRLYVRVPIRVKWHQENSMRIIEEETETSVVNAHGALIKLTVAPTLREHVMLHNISTNEIHEAIVVFISEVSGGMFNIGVEFAAPNPSFWQVSFPPEDWLIDRCETRAEQPVH